MGEGRAVFPVDGDVKARSVNLNSNVNRNVEHVWPSRQHVLFLACRGIYQQRERIRKIETGIQYMCSRRESSRV